MNTLSPNKKELFDQLLARLHGLAEGAEKGRQDAQENANEHAGRLESRYDTFKEEAQFLAAGQQHRHAMIHGWISTIQRMVTMHDDVLEPTEEVRTGAVVTLCHPDQGRMEWYFLAPAGGGEVLDSDAGPVEVLNVGSPLARTMLGKRAGQKVGSANQGSGAVIVEVR